MAPLGSGAMRTLVDGLREMVAQVAGPDVAEGRAVRAKQSGAIETYHRGLKQFCGVERCQARAARAQRNHIGWAIRAFLRLEYQRIRTGTSWFTTKLDIIRPALQRYLAQPSPILYGFVQYSGAHHRPTA